MAKAPTISPKTKRVSVIVVTAPAGPRRRAGFSFDRAETTFTQAELGENAERLVEAWRADPMLKIDVREVELPGEAGDTENQ
ncbi:hypothetical protein [Rhizobium sp. BK377]|uniref:hypothetical protein n=1 Tax=Rhizobium sp. BK377 TaxID=2587058 RepID=UPI00161D5961|nr:hypothetical protein [Rhizobium sp. BK377]MBB3461983.1 hypothetical protein [Rhizobium sp. BK377]